MTVRAVDKLAIVFTDWKLRFCITLATRKPIWKTIWKIYIKRIRICNHINTAVISAASKITIHSIYTYIILLHNVPRDLNGCITEIYQHPQHYER